MNWRGVEEVGTSGALETVGNDVGNDDLDDTVEPSGV